MAERNRDTVRLLLVEDEDSDAILVMRYLKHIDDVAITVERAAGLRVALERLARHEHDLVLLDLGLPEDRGLPVLRKVIAANAEVAVIVLTGLDDQAIARAAVREGAQDYLPKNETTADNLGRSIRYALERRHKQRERSELERRLAQSQRLEALGRFAGGIAHEINNRLMPIMGMADLMLNFPTDEPRRREMLALIVEAAENAGGLVKNLQTFARQRPSGEPQPVDLGALAGSMLQLVRAGMPHNVSLVTELPDGIVVRADPTKLQSLVMNLVSNAVDALADRTGEIKVAAVLNGSGVHLSVADDGPGIDPEVAARMFEPFFTTKEVNKGTGLGLSVVHGIVTEMGGTIAVKGSPGRGTTFDIHLPTVPSPLPPTATGAVSCPAS